MKIKAVCEATGLTDRTVRYYIEEGLITPFYTENYLGRKTFDFSDGDILVLNDIAVLRKFGFSIGEIREMLLHPEQIVSITKQLQERKQTLIREEQELLQALTRLDESRTYTVSELAAYLSEPVAAEPIPPEDTKLDVGKLLARSLKAALRGLVAWLPVVCCGLIILDGFRDYHYPAFSRTALGLLLLSLLPTWLMLLLPKFGKALWRRKAVKIILVIFCVLSIPFVCILSLGVVTHSETTDFSHYLKLDADCTANRNAWFRELFPQYPRYYETVVHPDGSLETVDLDAHYYYHYFQGLDHTFDIYAEWPLEEADFDAEVARVRGLFDAYDYATLAGDRAGVHYVTVSRGSYECLIIYNEGEPFEELTDSYTYFIFAYDEESRKVRYNYCSSLADGAYQPHYLSLDWEK